MCQKEHFFDKLPSRASDYILFFIISNSKISVILAMNRNWKKLWKYWNRCPDYSNMLKLSQIINQQDGKA